ncbi:MAG: hypothetical protein Q9187_003067 [Circinaria calcarea]
METAAEPLLPSSHPPYDTINPTAADRATDTIKMGSRSSWLFYAVASGACASFNGVFAKLTTTELTGTIAANISSFLHLGAGSSVVEYLIRAIFFALNLAFNAIMWFLFTRALTLHTSTTRVSIVNTSSNFMLTALLGLVIFSESLPPLWWVGAGALVVGNVIIGRRIEGGDEGKVAGERERRESGRSHDGARGEDVEEELLAGMEVETEDLVLKGGPQGQFEQAEGKELK